MGTIGKKVVALALSATVALSLCGCNQKGNVEFDEYDTYEPFRFYAYMTPPPANVGSGEFSSSPDYMTDQQYAWVAECGFNYALPVYESSKVNMLKALEGLGKYDVQFFVADANLVAMASALGEDPNADVSELKANFEANLAEYRAFDNFAGMYAADEPATPDFPGLGAVGSYFNSFEAGEWWINVFPNVVPNTQYQAKDYIEYLNRYVAETGVQRMSFDSYALMADSVRESHFNNLGQVAAVAQANDMAFDSFILTMGHNDYRTPTNYDDIAWQVYTAMAFGTKGIETFCYWTVPSSDSNITHGLIDHYGNRTQAWYSMQEVIDEVNAFESMYMNADWKGVMTYTADPDYPNFAMESIQPNVTVDEDTTVPVVLESHDRIASLDGDLDYMLGAFEDKDGRDAFLLANVADPAEDVSGEVTIKFNDCTNVVIYKKGRRVIASAPDGVFTTTIGSGEGYYIIPLQ